MHLLSPLVFPPLSYTVVSVEVAHGTQELQISDMAFPLSEAVELSFGSVPVEGVDVMELKFVSGPAVRAASAQEFDEAGAFSPEVLRGITAAISRHTTPPPGGDL